MIIQQNNYAKKNCQILWRLWIRPKSSFGNNIYFFEMLSQDSFIDLEENNKIFIAKENDEVEEEEKEEEKEVDINKKLIYGSNNMATYIDNNIIIRYFKMLIIKKFI